MAKKISADEFMQGRYNQEWWQVVPEEEARERHGLNVRRCAQALAAFGRGPIRVLVLHGSSRSNSDLSCAHELSNSQTLCRVGLDAIRGDPDVRIEEINLREYHIEPCNNCYSTASALCGFPCNCHPFDPMQDLYPKVLACDILLCSTGVNQSAMSSRLKLFCDRLISCFLDPDTPVFTRKGYKPISRMCGKHRVKGKPRATKLLNGRGKWESPSAIVHNEDVRYTGTAYRIKVRDSFGKTNSFLTTDDHTWVLSNGSRLRSDQVRPGLRLRGIAQHCLGCGITIPLSERVTCPKCKYACGSIASAKNRTGKTYEEWLGPERGEQLRDKRAKQAKGNQHYKNWKTPEGSWAGKRMPAEVRRKMSAAHRERHAKLRENPEAFAAFRRRISKSLRGSEAVKNRAEQRRGKTEVELFGERRAKEIQDRRNRARHRRAPNELEKTVTAAIESVGLAYRREVPIGQYCVDFLITELRLIVEADGQHWHDPEHDAVRDTWLRQQGYEVIRFVDTDYGKSKIRLFDAVQSELSLIANNHRGAYVEVETEVISVDEVEVENVRKYCYTMDEDHSFVVSGGVVSGNCDGGYFVAQDQFGPKDAAWRDKCIEVSQGDEVHYDQRQHGRVTAFFISSKDTHDHEPTEDDRYNKIMARNPYVQLVADSLYRGFWDFGYYMADPWFAAALAHPNEEMSFDKARLNADIQAQEQARHVVLAALDLAKQFRMEPPEPRLHPAGRT